MTRVSWSGEMARMLLLVEAEEERLRTMLMLRRRQLRDASQPMVLPERTFIKTFRLTKNNFITLCEDLVPLLSTPQRSTAIKPELKVNSDDHVYRACWDLAQLVIEERHSVEEARQLSQRHVCLRCGRSLNSHQATHTLHNNTARETRIYNVIKEWILLETIQEGNCICHPCWMAADRVSFRMKSGLLLKKASQYLCSLRIQNYR
ncbi:uncharacterized protein [Epargyreus clarus]|uniref:uncharacterized protein isoform X2 n=1 Tax=Epargyreus clarus TaxID=520877 RepID=UPI003C2F6BEF